MPAGFASSELGHLIRKGEVSAGLWLPTEATYGEKPLNIYSPVAATVDEGLRSVKDLYETVGLVKEIVRDPIPTVTQLYNHFAGMSASQLLYTFLLEDHDQYRTLVTTRLRSPSASRWPFTFSNLSPLLLSYETLAPAVAKKKGCIFIYKRILLIIVGMNEHPDNKYIQSLRAGDYSLLSVIYQKEAAHIRQWVCRNQGSVTDAQDVFQETIVALYQKATDPDFVLTCPMGALLFSIARNKWLTVLRQKKREDKVRLLEEARYEEKADTQSLLEAVEEEAIQQQKLAKTFRQLSETCQKLLQLLAKGLATVEVVTQMGMTDTNTLYRRKHACIGRWQTLFKALN